MNIHVSHIHTQCDRCKQAFRSYWILENLSMVIFTQALVVTSVSPVTLEPVRIIPHTSTSAQFTESPRPTQTRNYMGEDQSSVIAQSRRD